MDLFIEELKQKALELGVEEIGFSNLKEVVPIELSNLNYGISIVIRLSDAVINQIEGAPTFTYFHHYRDVNTMIDQVCLRLSIMIQQKGYLALSVPASQTVNAVQEKYRAIFSHKTAAVLAGLGWIGKSDLFVSEDYGPRVRLGTILTNMPLPKNEKIYQSMCGECSLCVSSCPANAIQGNNWEIGMGREKLVDASKCAEHMKKAYKDIGRGSVCGICVKECPKGKRVIRK